MVWLWWKTLQWGYSEILSILFRKLILVPVSVSKDVVFRDSDCFVAREIHNHYEVWERILRGFLKRDEFLTYI